MKRLFIVIIVLLLITVTAQGFEDYGDENKAEVEVESDLSLCSPELLFELEKQRAEADPLVPEEERLQAGEIVPRQWTEDDVAVISRMVWGEGRGVSRNEQKLIVWTVINRLENGRYGSSLIGVVRARGQFHGYSSRFPVIDEIREMVIEVLEAWDRGEAAKVYPPFARTPYYLYFHGDGRHNWFRERH